MDAEILNYRALYREASLWKVFERTLFNYYKIIAVPDRFRWVGKNG
jgi:hypothetical protein